MIKIEYQNVLPHIAPLGATFFVTFCLHDALSSIMFNNIKKEFEKESAIIDSQGLSKDAYKTAVHNLQKLYFAKYDAILNGGIGAVSLHQDNIASIIIDVLRKYDGVWYALQAYCIMPNHVHILIDTAVQLEKIQGEPTAKNYVQLNRIMQHIKGVSARYINLELKQTGTFWQKDSYDHYVRNERERQNIVQYILQNPVKAGLVESPNDWEYSFSLPL